MLAELSCICGYIIIACPVPFPVVAVAFAFVGFGQALTIAYNNVRNDIFPLRIVGLICDVGIHR
jgi:hypothetical protein